VEPLARRKLCREGEPGPSSLHNAYESCPIPPWAAYGCCRHPPLIVNNAGERAMADLLYVVLGLGGFVLLGVLLRPLKRI